MEGRRLLDHVLDVDRLVSGPDEEQRPVGANPLVVGERHLDPLGAGLVPALAENREPLVRHLQGLRHALDPFVDLTEEHLVDPDAALPFVHSARSYPRGAP